MGMLTPLFVDYNETILHGGGYMIVPSCSRVVALAGMHLYLFSCVGGQVLDHLLTDCAVWWDLYPHVTPIWHYCQCVRTGRLG